MKSFLSHKYFILACIILLASFIRLYQLGNVPPSPNWDEVSLGYNAYSIIQTGRDEYGEFMPIILRSYDDYKPSLYMYLSIPFVYIFGLESYSIRFVSVLFGILAIPATYVLVKELLTYCAKLKERAMYTFLPHAAVLLLAISPWHIQFSRVAFESNAGLTLNILSVLFFLKGLKRHIFLIISVFCMGLNLYMYQSEKVFTPLLAIALVLIFRKELFSLPKKILFLAFVIGLVVSFPLLFETATNTQVLARAQGVSVFSDATPLLEESARKLQESREKGDVLGIIFNNRRIVYFKTVLSGYFSHFNLNWLFLNGDIARHHAPGMGLLYLWELPFLLVGIYFFLFGPFDRKVKYLLFSWFLLAPVPASITSGVPHAVRTLNFLPIFQIFSAIGVLTSVQLITKMKYKIAPLIVFSRDPVRIKFVGTKIPIIFFIFSLCFLLFLFNFLYYLNQYFVQLNYFTSQDWQYGYKEAVAFVKEHEHEYDKIVVSNKPHLDQSYMFFLFYLKYPPKLYQEEVRKVSGGFAENHKFGKYEFRPFTLDKENSLRTLYIGREEDIGSAKNSLKSVFFLDGKPAIVIAGK